MIVTLIIVVVFNTATLLVILVAMIVVIIAFVVALLGLIFYLLWRVRSTGAGDTATGPIHALLQLAKVIFPDEPDGDGEGIPYPVGGAYEEHARQEFEQYERAALKDEA